MDATYPMTETQAKTLAFVRNHFSLSGVAPTLQQIADNFGISKISAYQRVDQIIARGMLQRSKHGRLSLPDHCPCCGRSMSAA